MSVHKDKNGKWYIKHKNKTYRGFKTQKEAKLYEAQIQIEKDEMDNTQNKMTFEQAFRGYLDIKRESVTYGTKQKMENIYRDIIEPHFNVKKSIMEITKQDCFQFQNWLYDTEYKTTYKNLIINLFKAVFKHCERYYDIPYNPSNAMTKFKTTFEEKQEKKEKQFNIWSNDEFAEFVQCVSNETYRIFFIVLYYTGMRKGEALALQWKDYKKGIFDINKNLTNKTTKRGYEIKDTKNIYSNRKVPVGNNVASLIEKYQQREKSISGYNDNWYIFGRDKPISTTNIDRVKKEAIKQSGVKTIRIHDIRHSHASNLFAQHIDYISISKRLGHNSPQTTLNIYAHMLESTNEVISDYLNESSQNLLKIFSTKNKSLI